MTPSTMAYWRLSLCFLLHLSAVSTVESLMCYQCFSIIGQEHDRECINEPWNASYPNTVTCVGQCFYHRWVLASSGAIYRVERNCDATNSRKDKDVITPPIYEKLETCRTSLCNDQDLSYNPTTAALTTSRTTTLITPRITTRTTPKTATRTTPGTTRTKLWTTTRTTPKPKTRTTPRTTITTRRITTRTTPRTPTKTTSRATTRITTRTTTRTVPRTSRTTYWKTTRMTHRTTSRTTPKATIWTTLRKTTETMPRTTAKITPPITTRATSRTTMWVTPRTTTRTTTKTMPWTTHRTTTIATPKTTTSGRAIDCFYCTYSAAIKDHLHCRRPVLSSQTPRRRCYSGFCATTTTFLKGSLRVGILTRDCGQKDEKFQKCTGDDAQVTCQAFCKGHMCNNHPYWLFLLHGM